MAYYDQFTKRPRSKRDDWRDDEQTRRPARDAGMNLPEGDAPRRFGDRPQENRRYGERTGAPRRYDDRPQGERRYGDKPQGDYRYGDRPQSERRYADRPGAPRRDSRPVPRADANPRPAMPPRAELPQEEPRENLLVGRNPIREALRAGRDIEKLLVARGELIGSAREIVAMARERRVVVQEVNRARLDAMAPGHQGLIAVVSAYNYGTVEDMFALAKSRGEEPFFVILDGVTDPHNLGAIIRSAECAGAHGVIIPERRAVGLTPAAVKASAGAVEHLPVAREVNLARLIERLRREGVWVYGAAMEGDDFRKVDFSGPAALVIGSEGDGLSRIVREKCDRLVGLPMRGKIGSLNASVAAGVLLYAVMGARERA